MIGRFLRLQQGHRIEPVQHRLGEECPPGTIACEYDQMMDVCRGQVQLGPDGQPAYPDREPIHKRQSFTNL